MSDLILQLKPLAPVLTVFVGALIAIMAGVFIRKEERGALPFIALTTVGAALVVQLNFWNFSGYILHGALKPDPFSAFIGVVVLVGAALAILISVGYGQKTGIGHGEFYGLMLTASGGMMLLAMSHDFVTLFISLEITSIPIYALTGLARNRRRSAEGAMKYVILGAFSTAFLLFGIAFIYGLTGKTAIAPALLSHDMLGAKPLLVAGLALFSVGLLFKLGAAPFHVWVPDAYEGAPAPVTAFMSVAVKAAAFGAFIRVLMTAFSGAEFAPIWWKLIWVVALVTLILGNFIAIYQKNVKRMLAYSGIAHSGYILVALTAQGASLSGVGTTIGIAGISAILFYLLVYTVTTAGAFGVVAISARGEEDFETLEDFAGLSTRKPLIAACMAIFLVSLAGVPPFGGFMAKFFVFKSAIDTGSTDLIWLAILGIITSMASLYFYLRVLVYMYFREPATARETIEPAWGLNFALFLSVTAVLVLGIFPGKFLALASKAAQALQFIS